MSTVLKFKYQTESKNQTILPKIGLLKNKTAEKQLPRLLDQVRDAIKVKHYSRKTEKSYIFWIKRYIFFHNKKHPKDMGSQEIEKFLTDLAVNKKVSASTQNQAFSALLFLYAVCFPRITIISKP